MERLQAVDEGTLFWFEGCHRPGLDDAMKFLTHLGDRWTLFAVVLVAALVFWLYGRRRTACIVLATALLGVSISWTVKHVVNRPRPDVAWRLVARPHDASFPSGHALNSMTIYGAIALTAACGLRRRAVQGLLIALGLGLPLLIGVTRPYLGVHYPSDILAGWTAGLACALGALWAEQRWGESRHLALPAKQTDEPSVPSV